MIPAIQNEVINNSYHKVKVGDIFICKKYDHTIIKVREIRDDENNTVAYDHATNYSFTEWRSYGSDSMKNFLSKIESQEYSFVERPLEDMVDEANKVISGEIPLEIYSNNEYSNINTETALIGRTSKDSLIAITKDLEQKKNTALLIHKFIGLEMQKRKQALERIKDRMYGIVAAFEKQVKKIMRVITTIELYLGVDEELHQIQEGEKADIKEPICFRQMVLFIDEEVGTHEKGGLDFSDIKKFDEWLLKDKNIDIVAPEKKSVVVLRPRRKDKSYGDPFMDVLFNEKTDTILIF